MQRRESCRAHQKYQGVSVLWLVPFSLVATILLPAVPKTDLPSLIAAINVLTEDMSMNMALPCRISVYEESGKTKIGMIKPTTLLASLSQSKVLMGIAEEVEQKTIQMIEDAK